MPEHRAIEGGEEATMTAFTIDTDDNITAFASTEDLGELREGTQSFANEVDLARLAALWPGSRLVEIWNGLPGVQPVQKFTNRMHVLVQPEDRGTAAGIFSRLIGSIRGILKQLWPCFGQITSSSKKVLS